MTRSSISLLLLFALTIAACTAITKNMRAKERDFLETQKPGVLKET